MPGLSGITRGAADDLVSGSWLTNLVDIHRYTDNSRVIANHKRLELNPYIVFVSALPMIGAAYYPPPDAALKDVEKTCLNIRAAWNSRV